MTWVIQAVATSRAAPAPGTIWLNRDCPALTWNTLTSTLRYHGYPCAVSPWRMNGLGFFVSSMFAAEETDPPPAFNVAVSGTVEVEPMKPNAVVPSANETLKGKVNLWGASGIPGFSGMTGPLNAIVIPVGFGMEGTTGGLPRFAWVSPSSLGLNPSTM